MPIPEGPGLIPAWNYAGGSRQGDALTRYMDERLRALEFCMQRVARVLNHGPISGAYFPVTMRIYNDGSTLAPTNEGAPVYMNFNVAPHYLAVEARTGARVTVQLVDDANEYLVTPLDTGAPQPWVNVRSGFTVNIMPKPCRLRLRLESVLAGAPVEVVALFVAAHVQKVDDPQV